MIQCNEKLCLAYLKISALLFNNVFKPVLKYKMKSPKFLTFFALYIIFILRCYSMASGVFVYSDTYSYFFIGLYQEPLYYRYFLLIITSCFSV